MSPLLSESDQAAIDGDLYAGRKLEAIKRFKEKTGVSLEVAKVSVDARETLLRVTRPDQFAPIQSGAFGAAAVLLALTLLIVGAYLAWMIVG